MKVKTLANNQYIITTDKTETFQSYDTFIAQYNKKTGVTTLNTDYEQSRTTMKYLVKFLQDDNIKDVRKKVADKVYKIKDLIK